jgi:hypothetical protein
MEFTHNLIGSLLSANLHPALVQDIRQNVTRFARSSDAISFHMTLIPFHTFATEGNDLPPIFDSIPTVGPRTVDTLESFTAIVMGNSCLPPCEIDGNIGNLKFSPVERDRALLPQMFDLLISSSQKFGGCQPALAHFFLITALYDLDWLLASQFSDRITSDDFVKSNSEAVLIFAVKLSAIPRGTDNEAARSHVHRICQRSCSVHQGPAATVPVQCLGFIRTRVNLRKTQ